MIIMQVDFIWFKYTKHRTKKCLFRLNPSNRYFIFQLESRFFVFTFFNHFRLNKQIGPSICIWRSITKCYGADSSSTKSSVSTHVKIHWNYNDDANQFIIGRKRVFFCKMCVEGKQTIYAEHQTQPCFNCQMQSSSVTKDHPWCCK